MPLRVRFRIFRSADFRSEKWFSPQVFTIERQQVESERDRTLVIYPTMQGVEIRHTIRTNPNDLGIDDCGPVDPRSTLDNQRVAFRPVGTVHRVEPKPDHREHGSAADSRRLQLVRPPGPVGGLAATIEQQG